MLSVRLELVSQQVAAMYGTVQNSGFRKNEGSSLIAVREADVQSAIWIVAWTVGSILASLVIGHAIWKSNSIGPESQPFQGEVPPHRPHLFPGTTRW